MGKRKRQEEKERLSNYENTADNLWRFLDSKGLIKEFLTEFKREGVITVPDYAMKQVG